MDETFDLNEFFERAEYETHPSLQEIMGLAYRIDSLMDKGATPDQIAEVTARIRDEAGHVVADMKTQAGLMTLAEAERRWRKTNLRQNKGGPRRWKMGREWWTSRREMEAAYGPEPNEWEAAYDKAGRS